MQRVWAKYFKPANRTVGLFYPDQESRSRRDARASPTCVALVKDYKGDAASEQGEEFDASPANIEARTVRRELPGGMQMSLLPKKTRGGAVFVGAGACASAT